MTWHQCTQRHEPSAVDCSCSGRQKLIADVTEIYKQANAEQVKHDKDFKNMFRNAPNLICVCSPANGGGELDAGLLGENIMLAAQSMGLGTCCLGGPVRFLLMVLDVVMG